MHLVTPPQKMPHALINVVTNCPIRRCPSSIPNAAGVRLPAFARILDHQPISQYKYRGMYVRAEKRFAKRYQFLVSYTLANNRDDNPQAQVTNQNNYSLDWGPAGIDRRHSLVASGSTSLPWKVNLGIIWQIRSSLPFSAFSTVQVDGITQYIPGLSRNLGNRNNAAVLAAVNAYRASLASPLPPIAQSQIDSSRFNSFDIVVSRPIYLRENFRIDGQGASVQPVRRDQPYGRDHCIGELCQFRQNPELE